MGASPHARMAIPAKSGTEMPDIISPAIETTISVLSGPLPWLQCAIHGPHSTLSHFWPMLLAMLAWRQEFEIFISVILLVPILVMNDVGADKRPTKTRFHDHAVFADPSVVRFYFNISMAINYFGTDRKFGGGHALGDRIRPGTGPNFVFGSYGSEPLGLSLWRPKTMPRLDCSTIGMSRHGASIKERTEDC
jgi:hypothetical protein